jgi:SAM-dependent methyltransferase
MSKRFEVYIKDTEFNLKYKSYQKKYQKNIRESDKKLIEKINFLKQKNIKSNYRILDVGCSTGNLLYHIKSLFPSFCLSGLDLETNVVDFCKLDSNLKDIKFTVGSSLEMGNLFVEKFDIIILNAIVVHLNDSEFDKTISEAFKILSTGGSLMMFDYFNPFEQNLEIIERSSYGSDQGIPLYFKSYKLTKSILHKTGFDNVEFDPFYMPVDLPLKKNDYFNLSTYTLKTDSGDRISMRGSLFQPWCHVYATKI